MITIIIPPRRAGASWPVEEEDNPLNTVIRVPRLGWGCGLTGKDEICLTRSASFGCLISWKRSSFVVVVVALGHFSILRSWETRSPYLSLPTVAIQNNNGRLVTVIADVCLQRYARSKF